MNGRETIRRGRGWSLTGLSPPPPSSCSPSVNCRPRDEEEEEEEEDEEADSGVAKGSFALAAAAAAAAAHSGNRNGRGKKGAGEDVAGGPVVVVGSDSGEGGFSSPLARDRPLPRAPLGRRGLLVGMGKGGGGSEGCGDSSGWNIAFVVDVLADGSGDEVDLERGRE